MLKFAFFFLSFIVFIFNFSVVVFVAPTVKLGGRVVSEIGAPDRDLCSSADEKSKGKLFGGKT